MLRPFYSHPIAHSPNLSREAVKCSDGLTDPSALQPVTRPWHKLLEGHRQKSDLETPSRSGASWNDSNQVRVRSRRDVNSLVSHWVENQNLSGHVPDAHGLMNIHSDRQRHAGVCNKMVQNCIGKPQTDDRIQKHDVLSHKPNVKTGKSLVGSFQDRKSVGCAAVINGYVQNPCSKLLLNVSTETPELGLRDFSRGIRVREIACFSRSGQVPKIGCVSSGKQRLDAGETLSKREHWLQDGRTQVDYNAHGNNSVKELSGCKSLLYQMPSKLPRPCSVKKDCCGNLVEFGRGSNKKSQDTSGGETISQNNRKISKAGRSPGMRHSVVSDSKDFGAFQCKANDRFGDRTGGKFCDVAGSGSSDQMKLKFSAMTIDRDFDKTSRGHAGNGILDKINNRISCGSVQELSDKAKNKFYLEAENRISQKIVDEKAYSAYFCKLKQRFHEKDSDFDKADSAFFNKANVSFCDKAGSTFHVKAEYKDFDKTNRDKVECKKVDRIAESVDCESIVNSKVKRNDRVDNTLHSWDNTKSADKVNSGAIYKTRSRLPVINESIGMAAGKSRFGRFSDKAVTRSNEKAGNSLFSETSTKLIYAIDNPFNIKEHIRLVDMTEKEKRRQSIDKANSGSNDKDGGSLIDKVNSQSNDKTDIRSSDRDHSSLIDKADSSLVPSRKEASRVPHRGLTGVCGKQNNLVSTKPDNTVSSVAGVLQSSHVKKPCCSSMTKIQRAECPYSSVTLNNVTAKSCGSVTLKNYKDAKSSRSVRSSSQKTCKTVMPRSSVVLRNCKDESAIGSLNCSSQKTSKIAKPLNSPTSKSCRFCVPLSRRSRMLCQNGKASPSKIPIPVKEPTGRHLSEISQLADVIPESWARVMQPFLELLRMSDKEVLCRRSVDCPGDKLNQQMHSKIPRRTVKHWIGESQQMTHHEKTKQFKL